MKNPNRRGALLRLVADILDRLSDDDVSALLEGRSRLELARRTAGAKTPRSKTNVVDSSALVRRLQDARTRADAAVILQGDGMTKVALEAIARSLDLPILRSDTAQRLRDKIVEAVIGYRINSEAIRGRAPDGSA
jgi:hypothetical protein